jgi:hypothetical protein
MGTQLPLPAGWARAYSRFRDPRDRLDALAQDRLDAKARIRAVLDDLAEKYNVPTADVTDAMGWVDDGLGDLLYDIEQGFRHEIEGDDPADRLATPTGLFAKAAYTRPRRRPRFKGCRCTGTWIRLSTSSWRAQRARSHGPMSRPTCPRSNAPKQ